MSNLPVSLGVFLPHDGVKLVVVLVAEDEADVVVVDLRVDKEGSLKVDAAEPVKADGEAWVRVHGLDNLGALHPDDRLTSVKMEIYEFI